MKKLYSSLLMLTFAAFVNAQVVHTVSTSPYNIFIPVYLDVFSGDTIRFEYDGNSYPHTTTSTDIPSGATPWDAELSTQNPSFDLVLSVVGTYDYVCTPHINMNMVGQITVLPTQSDYDIVGNWSIDSTEMTAIVFLDDETLAFLMAMSAIMTPEEFLEDMGFPMPASNEEWTYLAENGFPITVEDADEDIGLSTISFSTNYMTIYSTDGPIQLSYELTNDSTITILSTSEDIPFTEFDILNLNESALVLSTTVLIDEEEGIEQEATLIFYCSAIEELIFGCTDEDAQNYNSEANTENGSCNYPYLCGQNQLLLKMYDDAEDGWEGSELLINGVSYTLDDGESGEDCVDFADCYIFSTIEGDFMNEAYWILSNEAGVILYEGVLPFYLNDTDDDLICDEIDNCTDLSNPDQLDMDNDGEGDACDYDDGVGVEELEATQPSLLKMIDVLGREYMTHPEGKLLFYIYSNGSIKKQIRY